MESDRRQLAAIMLTDIVGYTALTQSDEALTLALLGEHTAIVRPLFAEHSGREVKSTGDGFLVEFSSALAAVRCAIEIQRALHERNNTPPLGQAIHSRIGIHLGDVVHRGGDIFGDGVNIAARIEPLAEPGGICLSRQVYDQVWNKIDLRMLSLGRKDLKNVKVQIEVYGVLLPWLQDEPLASRAADHSRLAVLPLVSMSPDPADEYFADGLTEELIFTLSKARELQIIALTSVMKYRGAKKAVSEIGSELAVGAVLEGSVRKAGNRLRITLQLIDVAAESHLWSEAYDRALDDVFAVQSEVARSVAAALEGQLLSKPFPPAAEPSQANPKAYAAYLKGRALLSSRTLADIRSAIRSFERAVGLDPSRAESHAALAMAYGLLSDYASSAPADTWMKARASALAALSLDSDLPEAHAALGLVLESEWDWCGAEREFRRAVDIVPSYAQAHHWLGIMLLCRGRFDEAIASLEASIALDPLSGVQHGALGQAFWWAGRPDRALSEFELQLLVGGDNRDLRLVRGLIYLEQGRVELARSDIEKAKEFAGSDDPEVELAYAQILEASGEKGAVDAALGRALAVATQEPISPYVLSLYYFAIGQADKGFELLERGYEARDPRLPEMAGDPYLAMYRSDPRYMDLLQRLGILLSS